VCWLSIYFEVSSSLLLVALVDLVVCFHCTVPFDPVMGASSKIHNNWYQSKVNVKMSAIKFDIQKFDGVINFSRWQIRMNAILTQSGLKKALLGREKKPQDMKEETYQELDEKVLTTIQLCLTDEVLDKFSMEKTTSEPLSEEVIGESVDSEVASLSSPHA